MQLSRARFLSSALTTCHGVFLRSVCANIASLALEYSTQRLRDSTSIGLSFQRLIGFRMRSWKRRSCSSSLTENQYLTRWMPERTSISSKIGQVGAQELLILLLGAEPHDVLDAGAIVPAAIEQHDFTARRQLGDIALKIPL